MSERGRYKFTVKESAKGTPWIAAEPMGPEPEVLCEGILGFDLREGATLDEAREIAHFLNDHVAWVSYTKIE